MLKFNKNLELLNFSQNRNKRNKYLIQFLFLNKC